jgi:uncharacterized membrane protein YbhN (UPF0104 family)
MNEGNLGEVDKKTARVRNRFARFLLAVLKNKYFWFVVFLVLTVVAVAHFDIREGFKSLRAVPWWVILIVIALQTIAQFSIFLQWKIVAKSSGVNVKFNDMAYIDSQGYIVEAVTPGVKFGGEAIRTIQIRKYGNCGTSRALSVIALQKLFSIGVFLVITILSVTFMLQKVFFLNSVWAEILLYGVQVLTLAFILSIFVFPHKYRAFFDRGGVEPLNLDTNSADEVKDITIDEAIKAYGEEDIIETITKREEEKRQETLNKILQKKRRKGAPRRFVIQTLDAVIAIRRRPFEWLPILLLCLFDWIVYPIKVVILAHYLLPDAGVFFLTSAVFIAYMVAMLPIFPGGLGGFEATMASMLVLGGCARPESVCITVIFRLVSFWYTILLSGAIIAIYKGFKRSKNGKTKKQVC